MEVTPPKSENGILSPKRFSGDGQTKPAGPFRKKSGFSSFVNNMLGSPRTIKISAPENPMHMIHVGYDNQTGQFTVSSTGRTPTGRAPGDVSSIQTWWLINYDRVCLRTGSEYYPTVAFRRLSRRRTPR